MALTGEQWEEDFDSATKLETRFKISNVLSLYKCSLPYSDIVEFHILSNE